MRNKDIHKQDNASAHLSKDYDFKINSTIPYYYNLHAETINLIKSMDFEPKIWLDTGCGTGTLVQKAMKSFKDTKFLLADPSEGMLNEARVKLRGKNRIKFLKPTPSHQLSLSINLDVITAIQSHHYMNKEERFNSTENCYDLLNKNGVYIVFENISPFTERGIEIGKKYWKDFQMREGKSKVETKDHIKRFNVEYFPLNVEEHLELLRSCDFKVVEIFWYSYMQAGFYCIK